jgi:hypothetical protein
MKNKLIILCSLASLSFANEYQEWLKSQQQEYKTYVKTLDEEFMDMLKKDWEFYQTLQNPSAYKKPKPTTIPVVKEIKKIPKKEIEKSVKVNIKPIIKVKPIKIKKVIVDPNKRVVSFDYFGSHIKINIDKEIEKIKMINLSKDNISSFWNQLNRSDYKNIIKQINSYCDNLGLNDWGRYIFINTLATNIYQYEPLQVLFNWFVLSKMDYDVKVGYNKSRVFLLSTMAHGLFSVSYFNLDDKKYYVITPNGRINKVGQIYTYKGVYKQNSHPLSFEQKAPMNLANSNSSKDLTFDFNRDKFNIKVEYNKNLVDFYKSFPQSDYDIYFKSKKSSLFSQTILSKLKDIIKDKNEIEAVNMLLRLTQKSFKYKTDPNQFGYEKVLFPEETMHYPYSDCEDRSIFFGFLVENLLGLKVVAVKYSDHLATAVRFSTNVSGDSFTYKGEKFVITDPTYINANIGMAMPQYKNSDFKVIDF